MDREMDQATTASVRATDPASDVVLVLELAQACATAPDQRERTQQVTQVHRPGGAYREPRGFMLFLDTIMNKYSIALPLALIVLSTSRLTAQAQTDSVSSVRKAPEQKNEKFVDQDGDGIDDRMAGSGKGLQRGRDKFIDRDGDGICDDRANGLGYRRGGMGAEQCQRGDAKGKGKRQGQGGKP